MAPMPAMAQMPAALPAPVAAAPAPAPVPAMPAMPAMPGMPAMPSYPGMPMAAAAPVMAAMPDMAALQKQIQDNLEQFYTTMQGGMAMGGGGGGGNIHDGKESGYVINWNVEKGFGFIKPDKGGDDIFAHVTALKDGDCLREGDQVRFNIKFDEKVSKYRAEDVVGAWWERDLERERKYDRDRRDSSRSRHRGRGRRRDDSRDRTRDTYYGRTAAGQEVCRQFQRRGNCDFGEKCKFWHDGGEKRKKSRDRTRERSRRKSKSRRKSRSKSRRKSKSASRSKSRDKDGKYIFRSDEH